MADKNLSFEERLKLLEEKEKKGTVNKPNAITQNDPLQKRASLGGITIEDWDVEEPRAKGESLGGFTFDYGPVKNKVPAPKTFSEGVDTAYSRDPFEVGTSSSDLSQIWHPELNPQEEENLSFETKTGLFVGKYILPMARDIAAFTAGITGGAVAGSAAAGFGAIPGGIIGGVAVGAPMGAIKGKGEGIVEEYLADQELTKDELTNKKAFGALKGAITGGLAPLYGPGSAIPKIVAGATGTAALNTGIDMAQKLSEDKDYTAESALQQFTAETALDLGINLALKAVSKGKANYIANKKNSISGTPSGSTPDSPNIIHEKLKTDLGQQKLFQEGASLKDVQKTAELMKPIDEILFNPDLPHAEKTNLIKKKLWDIKDESLPDSAFLDESSIVDIAKLKRSLQMEALKSVKSGEYASFNTAKMFEKEFIKAQEKVIRDSTDAGRELFESNQIRHRIHEIGAGKAIDAYETEVLTRLKTKEQNDLYAKLLNKSEEEWAGIINQHQVNLQTAMNSREIELTKEAAKKSFGIMDTILKDAQAVEIKTKPDKSLVLKDASTARTKVYEVKNKYTDELIATFTNMQDATSFINKPKVIQGLPNYAPQVLDFGQVKKLGAWEVVAETLYKASPGRTENGIRYIKLANGKEISMPLVAKVNSRNDVIKRAREYEDVYHAYEQSRRMSQTSKFGQFHYDRKYEWPRELLLEPHKAFGYYAWNAYQHIASTAVWGDNNVKLFKDVLPRLSREAGVKYDQEGALKVIGSAVDVVERLSGLTKIDRGRHELFSMFKNLNILRTMGFSFLSQGTQWFAPITYGESAGPTFKYLRSIITNKNYTESMIRKAGTNYEMVGRELMNSLADEVQLNKAASIMLKPMKFLDAMNRKHAAGYGMFFMDGLVNKLNKGNYDITIDGKITKNGKLADESDKVLRHIKKMDVDPKQIIGEKIGDKWTKRIDDKGLYFTTENQKLTAMRKAEIDTNFRGYFEKFPEIRNSEHGSLITQLGTFKYFQTENIYRNVIQELKYGNIKPLAAHLIANGVSGAVATEMLMLIGCGLTVAAYKAIGRDDLNYMNYYQSTSYFQKFMAMPNPETAVAAFIRAMSKAGGFGFAETVMSITQYGDPGLGPTIGGLYQTAKGIQKINEYGYDSERAKYQGYPALIAGFVPVPATYFARAFNLAYEADSAKFQGKYNKNFMRKYGSAEGRVQYEQKKKDQREKSDERRRLKMQR